MAAAVKAISGSGQAQHPVMRKQRSGGIGFEYMAAISPSEITVRERVGASWQQETRQPAAPASFSFMHQIH